MTGRPATTSLSTAAGIAVLSAAWGTAGDESAFAARVLAGAASRLGPVDVLGPWDPGPRADGAFDPYGLGRAGPGRRWPSVTDAAIAGARGRGGSGAGRGAGGWRAVLVDAGDADAVDVAGQMLPGVPVLEIGGGGLGTPCLELVPGAAASPLGRPVGLHVPVHALARERPHLELGPIADYLLVLSGRPPQASDPDRPPDPVAWLVARYPRRPAVVVENGVASVWRSRSRLRRFSVHTRMDLWRLMAHARATVDLGPGALFGRECVESIRYGVPVVVPAGSGAEALAAAGAGLRFEGTPGLLEAAGRIEDDAVLDGLREGGAPLERWFGRPAELVDRLAKAVESAAGR